MAINIGQHTAVGASSDTPVTGSLTTQATGSTFVVVVQGDTGTVGTPTDSKSNTYTALGAQLTLFSQVSRAYYIENGVGGSGHTFQSTVTGASFASIYVVEITGALTSGALDQTARGTDDTTPFLSPGITTTQAAEILIGCMLVEGPGGTWDFTPGNSFVTTDKLTDGNTVLVGYMSYRIVAATATYNTSSTASQTPDRTGNWIASFKEAGGAPTAALEWKQPTSQPTAHYNTSILSALMKVEPYLPTTPTLQQNTFDWVQPSCDVIWN